MEAYIKTLCFDIETISDKSIILLLPQPTADSRLKDSDKIKADIERKQAENISKMGIVPTQNLICCVGYYSSESNSFDYLLLSDESARAEASLLTEFWDIAGAHEHFITFNGVAFDIPTLELHSARARIRPSLRISRKRYAIENHLDCYAFLSDWQPKQGNLDFYSQYFNVGEGKKGMTGLQVQGLWDLGEYDKIIDYCLSDVRQTWEIGQIIMKYLL